MDIVGFQNRLALELVRLREANLVGGDRWHRIITIKQRASVHRHSMKRVYYNHEIKPDRPNFVVPETVPDNLIAIDLEWTRCPKQQTTEIGYVTVIGGAVTSHSLMLTDKKCRFQYGESRYLSRADGYAELMAAVERADLIVGHSFADDMIHLARHGVALPKRPIADTQRMHRALVKKSAQRTLTHLCEHYGVEITTAHVAGNDAMMTLSVFMAMLR